MSKRIPALVKPTVLIWARETAGYSIDDFAAKLKKEPKTIEAWESGEQRPFMGQLRRLSNIYKRSISDFYLPAPPQERLRSVRSVKDELGDGDLRNWCLEQTDFFVDEDEKIQRRVAQLMATYQNPKKPRGIDKADPFVIALADVQDPKWIVVSAERGGSLENNPKIPVVCRDTGVEHIRFIDMLRIEGWSL